MNEYPKKIKKILKELASLSHQRELAVELKVLHERFNDWENNKIDVFELNEYIHIFHNGASQEIWKKHNHADTDMIVSSSAAFGILRKDEIPDEVFKIIEKRVEYMQREMGIVDNRR